MEGRGAFGRRAELLLSCSCCCCCCLTCLYRALPGGHRRTLSPLQSPPEAPAAGPGDARLQARAVQVLGSAGTVHEEATRFREALIETVSGFHGSDEQNRSARLPACAMRQ